MGVEPTGYLITTQASDHSDNTGKMASDLIRSNPPPLCTGLRDLRSLTRP